jgi:hypothetical protein
MHLTSVSAVRSGGSICLNLPVQGFGCSFYDGILLIPPHTRNISGIRKVWIKMNEIAIELRSVFLRVFLKLIFIILILIITIPLLANENHFSKSVQQNYSNTFKIIKLSPGLLYGASIGLGKQNIINESRVESIIAIHYNEGSIIQNLKAAGLYYQYNVFLKKERKGLFGLLNLGLDYALINETTKVAPNLTFGSGFSFQIGSKSFLRFELDLGIKLFLTNLNVVIIF